MTGLATEREPLRANPDHHKKQLGLTRRKADELVASLPGRIAAINADPEYLYGICRLVIFGSYLTDKEKLGDIDLAVRIAPKLENSEKHWDLCAEQSHREAVNARNCVDHIFWPQNKALRALRGRNYVFSLHEFSEYERMAEEWKVPGREIYRNVSLERNLPGVLP